MSPNARRFVIGLQEPVVELVHDIVTVFSPYIASQMLGTIYREIQQCAGHIAVATAIQLVSEIHQRQVSDAIVLDLICNELAKAFETVATYDRAFLMGVASRLQHTGEMAAAKQIGELLPVLGDTRYDGDHGVLGYCAHPGPMPYFTIDLKKSDGL